MPGYTGGVRYPRQKWVPAFAGKVGTHAEHCAELPIAGLSSGWEDGRGMP